MSSIVEYLRHVPMPVNTSNVLSVQWWLEYAMLAYNEDPIHVMIELTALAVILWLLIKPRYDPKKHENVSLREQEELIAEWKPEPLEPKDIPIPQPRLIVKSVVDRCVDVNGVECLNFTSANFIGLAGDMEINQVCRDTIDKYGVGSCGPRGFYGTIDVHLNLEEDICKFVNGESCIVYSDGLACVSSVIPAFSKKGDLIICDDSCHFGVQQGIHLTRSEIIYFKHNDVDDLERILKIQQPKELARKKLRRCFIIVEGVSKNHGDICPLREVVKLKYKYRYRLIVDDTYGFGVLGATGRGTPEYCRVPVTDIDAYVGSLDTSVASVGGFCVGKKAVTNHQRLAGAGYVFSASAPPYSATAASKALEIINREPQRCERVRNLARMLRQKLSSISEVRVVGGEDCESPTIHLRLVTSFGAREADDTFFRLVEQRCFELGVAVYAPRFVPKERMMPEPSLRLMVTSKHDESDLDKAYEAVRDSLLWAFNL